MTIYVDRFKRLLRTTPSEPSWSADVLTTSSANKSPRTFNPVALQALSWFQPPPELFIKVCMKGLKVVMAAYEKLCVHGYKDAEKSANDDISRIYNFFIQNKDEFCSHFEVETSTQTIS